MKKILSLVLVVAMMASLVVLAPTASAESTATVEVTDTVAQKGDTVTLDIRVTTASTLLKAQLALDYDRTRLELVWNNTYVTDSDVVDYTIPVTTVDSFSSISGTLTSLLSDGEKAALDPQTRIDQVEEDGELVDKVVYLGGLHFGTTAANGAAVKATSGVRVATVTFKVKEDAPAGDAFVRVINVPGNANVCIQETDSSTPITNYNTVDGIVTVLPEGYATAPYIPADSDWDFDPATGTIYSYIGEAELAGDIAIPSQIGGVDVVEIYADGSAGGSVLNGNLNVGDITSIVIPATVEYISKAAFINLASCSAIYVLNPDCEIADQAMGYDGAWRRGSFTASGQTLPPVGDDALLTLYGYAGSTAQTYAEIGDGAYPFGWGEYVAPTTVTIVAGDNTSAYEVSGNTITAPGASRVDGRVTVAWDVNGTKVAPGAEVAIDGDTTFTAITVAAPETTNGASIKAADGYAALRFTAEFSVAEYEALVAAFGAKNVKHGMLISTQDQIKAAGEFTHKLAKKIDFEMKGCWKVEDGNYVFAASVKNFSDSTLAKNYKFNAVAYVGIDLDGNGTVDTYVYGDYDWTCARDAKTVLANAIENAATSGLVGDQLTWAEAWFGKFN